MKPKMWEIKRAEGDTKWDNNKLRVITLPPVYYCQFPNMKGWGIFSYISAMFGMILVFISLLVESPLIASIGVVMFFGFGMDAIALLSNEHDKYTYKSKSDAQKRCDYLNKEMK